MRDDNIRLGLAVVASPLEVGANKAPEILDELQARLDELERLELYPYGGCRVKGETKKA